MNADYHYPPELLSLLIDTIPKLSKSRKDLLTFFRGAGTSETLLGPYWELLKTDRDRFNKYLVTRELLTALNEQGDAAIRVRRELVKRVVEFDDFSVCWENDQAPARGLVAQVRELVNVKDSFTRMRDERDEERRRRIEEQQARVNAANRIRAEREQVKQDLYALFAEQDAHKRGKALEAVLNRLFAVYGVLVREALTIKGMSSEGVTEQLDGVVEIESHHYLVEMKWLNSPVGPGEVAQHLVRVFGRGGQVRGLFISYSQYSDAAISHCRDAIAGGAVVVLATLQEIVELLEREGDLKLWLRRKVDAALAEKMPYVRVVS
jgi:hypothetical protein